VKKKQPGQAELPSYEVNIHFLVFNKSPFCVSHALMYERQTNHYANAFDMHMLLTVEDSNILALKCNKYFWVKLCTPLKGSIG